MTVGILGGGQLGRMMALAGYPLGLRFRFYDPGKAEAIQGLGEHVRAPWDDASSLDRFADGLSVATYEFENVPVDCARSVAERVPLRPGLEPLAIGQDRIHEKERFRQLGIPTPPFLAVNDRTTLELAIDQLGFPAVLKTRRDGYDGKGQRILGSPGDVETAWTDLGGKPLVLEGWVDFDREISVLGVRGVDRSVRFYPCAQNEHRDGILHRSLAPAPSLCDETDSTAKHYVRDLMHDMNYVGVLALELFERDGQFLANEFAPRVHNSGHWTQDGSWTSQFENHLRAICGMPLGETLARVPTEMTNIIGTAPNVDDLLSARGARVHLYGKSPRAGRKLGHVNMPREEVSVPHASDERG